MEAVGLFSLLGSWRGHGVDSIRIPQRLFQEKRLYDT
jgi:hypothetical protein